MCATERGLKKQRKTILTCKNYMGFNVYSIHFGGTEALLIFVNSVAMLSSLNRDCVLPTVGWNICLLIGKCASAAEVFCQVIIGSFFAWFLFCFVFWSLWRFLRARCPGLSPRGAQGARGAVWLGLSNNKCSASCIISSALFFLSWCPRARWYWQRGKQEQCQT